MRKIFRCTDCGKIRLFKETFVSGKKVLCEECFRKVVLNDIKKSSNKEKEVDGIKLAMPLIPKYKPKKKAVRKVSKSTKKKSKKR